ncbi:transcriptional regulatory protein MarR family [Scytonema sp. HK-05]|uniref:MarR family winged helix-turn-helix transcriptional regulator n=1 Tax=Scytonema sp. HK-05 TaxID=1137095 RepID=UPI000937CB34|nr:MarR family transcriptional regulator [Scytonema sp. HK-05]OKH51986.1 MarR family transcriptional regulator [Scytonema sp. HK-05]BAY48306.1 transcriptional regulatory protein MarR family [Scytonema sp. HK-05]
MVTLRPFVDKQTILDFAKRYPELDVASIETCLAFLHTTADVYQALDVHFARYGLSRGKFTLLMQLYQVREQGLTPSECAERVGVTRATITGLLDGLERDGLVRRFPDSQDRRMLRLQLTDKGQDLLSQMLPDHFCRTTGLMANLTDSEKKTLIKLLNKVCAGTPAMLDAE